ncbi:MAG: FKBP-type peptidyl-prolyl cis-trans isomerase [Bacteroidota bacterium]
MSQKKIIGIYFLLFLLACGNSQPPPTESTVQVQVAENEDDLLVSLASELISNPRTQAEKDKNALLNYMMDKGIALTPTESGLYYQMIEEGTGEMAVWGDWVTVNYKGYTLDGKVFDSSYKKGKPIQFYIGNMIAGWNEGLELMRAGGKALFLVPSGLAYGEKGFPNVIEPNTPLAFEVELLKIEQK